MGWWLFPGGVLGISSDGDDRMEWLSAKILAILRLSVNFFQVRLTKSIKSKKNKGLSC